MTRAIVRVQAVAFLGFLTGLLVCGASGYGIVGILGGGVVTGLCTGLAMVTVCAIEANDRRRNRPVVREPRISHVRPIEPVSSPTEGAA